MNTTRRHPRTLEEAFGPYQRTPISEPIDEMTLGDKVIIVVGGAIALGLLVCIIFGKI